MNTECVGGGKAVTQLLLATRPQPLESADLDWTRLLRLSIRFARTVMIKKSAILGPQH